MKATRHAGLHTHRFDRHPEEQRFAEAWAEQQRGNTLNYLLHYCGDQSVRPPDASDRDCRIAATVIQWLGSPVGQSFLAHLGYHKTDATR